MLCRIACVTMGLSLPSVALGCEVADFARGLPITDVAVTGMGDGNIYLSGTITNNLGFTVGDFATTITVLAKGRDAPIALQDRPANGLIPGGLMPGEAMRFEDWVHIEDRGVQLVEAAGEVTISMMVIAAADAELRYLLKDGQPYAGWQDLRSSHDCTEG